MEPVTLALIGLSGLALMRGRKGASAPVAVFTGNRAQEKQYIWALGKRVESMGALPGFAEFLLPVAHIESRFNPTAQNNPSANAARGWFGMRPESAFNWKNKLGKLATSQPNLLKNRAWAVAAAADYTRRLMAYREKGQRVTWRAIRRGWAYPKNVANVGGGTKNWNQFRNAIEATGVPLSMADQTVVVGNLPHLTELAKALGG